MTRSEYLMCSMGIKANNRWKSGDVMETDGF